MRDAVMAAIAALGRAAGVDAMACLYERGESVTRSCRLLRAADAWVAVNLARPDDFAAVRAWLEADVDADDADSDIAALVADRPAAAVVERARLLGLAASVLGERSAAPLWRDLPVRATRLGDAPPLTSAPRVTNLASLWAGPLCARILAGRGAEVAVPPSISLDSLLGADVVIEGSRPRALEQRGIDATAVVGVGPQVWLSITGHGRPDPERNWIGYGDDCAVAGALVEWRDGQPAFFADAVADPLTGMVAAAAIGTALAMGGRWLLDCNLAGVAAHVAAA